MARLIAAVALGLVLASVVGSVALADYSPRQKTVIAKIWDECDRQGVNYWGCLLPLYKADQETQYGSRLDGDYNRRGEATSWGIYQWFAGYGNNCVDGGLACFGPYYQRYGLRWRTVEAWDIEMGVRLLTSHLRGGPDYRSHWRVWAVPYNWTPPPRFYLAPPVQATNESRDE